MTTIPTTTASRQRLWDPGVTEGNHAIVNLPVALRCGW
jgi:hypothetical protein